MLGTNGINSKNNEEMSFIKYIADESHYKYCKECGRREYCSDPIKYSDYGSIEPVDIHRA